MEQKRRQYPNAPEYALPRTRYSDATANSLTKAILDYLGVNGHKAWRQSSEGRYRPGAVITDVIGRRRQMPGVWLPGQNKGIGDVCAIIHGLFVTWEVKVGRDRQSKVQRQFQQEVENSGGRYFIAHDFDQFLQQYRSIVNKND